jgi:hypothetical protein
MTYSTRVFLLGAAATVGVAGAPAAAQSQPSREWRYHEDAEGCRADRAFGTGSPELVQLRTFGPGSAVEVTVVSAQIPSEPSTVRPVALGWDGKPPERSQLGLLGAAGRTPTITVLATNRPVAAFLYLDQSTVLTSRLDPAAQTMQLRVEGTAPVELQVGSLEEPLRRLTECEARLMEKWGWGPDYSGRVASAPEFIDPQLMFYKVIDYPPVESFRRVSSILELRLKIDAEGKVADCVVQSSPGSPVFGSKNCDSFRRFARFKPALDAQGRPIDGYLQLSITFARFD